MKQYLPKEIVNRILFFSFDKRGYNTFDYQKIKKKNKYKMIRISTELKLWKSYQLSISWLKSTKSQSKNNALFLKSLKDGKPRVTYNKGFYKDLNDEIQILKNNNII